MTSAKVNHSSFLSVSGVFLLIFLPSIIDSMIITSVFAGPKKYKTATLDLFPFPLAWSTGNKLQFAYRGHYTFRRPYFNVNMNTPVTIPLDFNPPVTSIDSHKYESDGAEHTAATENDSTDETAGETVGEQQTPSQDDQSMNMNMNLDSQSMELQKQPDKYSGYDSSQSSSTPRPYTGKAQVSSFIDNGQFINAHSPVAAVKIGSPAFPVNPFPARDAVFGDEIGGLKSRGDTFSSMFPHLTDLSSLFPSTDAFSRRFGLSKGKTLSLGYDVLGELPKKDPVTLHNRHPDSMPWNMDYEGLQKYYTTFQFTDAFRDPSTYYSIADKNPLLQKILTWV